MELSPMEIKARELVKRIKDLKINGIEDDIGYQIVKEAYIETRDFINNVKDLRLDITRQYDDAKKQLITKEREIIAKVEPVKELLGSMRKEIDDEKLKAKIAASIPARKALLESIDLIVSDDKLLLMTDDKFSKFFTEKKGEYLDAKEAKMKEAEDKLAEEKRQAAEVKRIEDEKRDAVENALKDAAAKADKEKQDLIDAQVKKEKDAEDARIKQEQKEKDIEAFKIANEIIERNKREKNEKYQKFLKDCGYNEETKSDFKIYQSDNGEISIYKKVGSITL